MSDAADIALENIRRWKREPGKFVREVFNATPDPWQDEILALYPTHSKIVMQASAGPGKSCLMAWLGWNTLVTRANLKAAAVSISGANLRDNLWAELSKWRQRSPMLMNLFEKTDTRISYRHDPENWFLAARSWPRDANEDQLGQTMQGLHADNVLVLIDEAGGIPIGLLAVAERVLTTAKDGHIVLAGNPTHLDKALYHAARKASGWLVRRITSDPDDPLRSPRVSVDWAKQYIDDYGRDSPYVRVAVFGEFPSASPNSLLGPEECERSIKRHYRIEEFGHAAKVLGVDVARFGDDSSAMVPRQGLVMSSPITMHHLNSNQGATRVKLKWEEWQADACFIDDTGGFGSGWLDALALLGKQGIPVHFSAKADEARRYYNKRAEMAFDLASWVRSGGAMPNAQRLVSALTETTYSFKGDALILEPKEAVKKRLGYSPDEFDGAILTFAAPVTPRGSGRSHLSGRNYRSDWEPTFNAEERY